MTEINWYIDGITPSQLEKYNTITNIIENEYYNLNHWDMPLAITLAKPRDAFIDIGLDQLNTKHYYYKIDYTNNKIKLIINNGSKYKTNQLYYTVIALATILAEQYIKHLVLDEEQTDDDVNKQLINSLVKLFASDLALKMMFNRGKNKTSTLAHLYGDILKDSIQLRCTDITFESGEIFNGFTDMVMLKTLQNSVQYLFIEGTKIEDFRRNCRRVSNKEIDKAFKENKNNSAKEFAKIYTDMLSDFTNLYYNIWENITNNKKANAEDVNNMKDIIKKVNNFKINLEDILATLASEHTDTEIPVEG